MEVEIQQIIDKYNELGNVWKVGEALGISGQKVHSILKKRGLGKRMNYFTEADYAYLREHYEEYANGQRLSELAKIMKRTTAFLNRKAKELGLTKPNRKYKIGEERHKQLSNAAKGRIAKYGHPKGMMGKNHTSETKEYISKWHRQNWAEHRDEYLTEERRKNSSDNMAKCQADGILGVRSRTYMVRCFVNNKEYVFKSAWEVNIALVLEYERLLGNIDGWAYEATTFSFEYDGNGVRNYKPDFDVYKDGKIYHVEVKGWVDEKTKIKMDLMQRFYPNDMIYMMGEKEYRSVKAKYKPIIPQWGFAKTISNDNRCVKIVAEKFIDKDNPRIEFKIVTIE